MASKTNETASRTSLKSLFVALRRPDLTSDEMLKIYDEWTEKSDYDSDLLKEGYEAPAVTVKYTCDSFPLEKRGGVKVLDVGAGTGLVARGLLTGFEAFGPPVKNFALGVSVVILDGASLVQILKGVGLRAQGFHHIDALDPSAAMLDVAKKNDLYENYFCEFITEKALPIPPDTYDAVTASGCFGVSLVPCGALYEMIRLVKPGGVIIIVTKDGHADFVPQYKGQLIPLMNSLEEKGQWKKIVVETGLQYCMDEKAVVWKYQVLVKSSK